MKLKLASTREYNFELYSLKTLSKGICNNLSICLIFSFAHTFYLINMDSIHGSIAAWGLTGKWLDTLTELHNAELEIEEKIGCWAAAFCHLSSREVACLASFARVQC